MNAQVPLAREPHPTFEQADGVVEFSSGNKEKAETKAHGGQAVGVIHRLSESNAFLAVGDPFLELSLVSEKPSQVTAGHHGRKSWEAKLFPAQITVKQS